MKTGIISILLFLSCTVTAQKICVSEIDESRSTTGDSYKNKCDIELKISGDEVRKFRSAKILKINRIQDDQGLDLIDEEKINYSYTKIEQDAKIELEVKVPSRKAGMIRELSGEICLFNPSETNGSIVKVTNYQNRTNTNLLPEGSPVQIMYLTKESLAKYVKENKEKTSEELKNMPEIAREMTEGLLSAFEGFFGFDENDPNQAFFYISGDESKLVEMYFEDAKGIKVERNGSTSSNNLLAYFYDEKPKPAWKLVFNIETPASVKIIPFHLTDIELP